MSPMYDFDFTCGNERIHGCNVERTIDNKNDLISFVNHYKEKEWFSKWIKEKVLTLQINDIHFEENNNKPSISNQVLSEYARFFELQKRQVELGLANTNTLEEIQ